MDNYEIKSCLKSYHFCFHIRKLPLRIQILILQFFPKPVNDKEYQRTVPSWIAISISFNAMVLRIGGGDQTKSVLRRSYNDSGSKLIGGSSNFLGSVFDSTDSKIFQKHFFVSPNHHHTSLIEWYFQDGKNMNFLIDICLPPNWDYQVEIEIALALINVDFHILILNFVWLKTREVRKLSWYILPKLSSFR